MSFGSNSIALFFILLTYALAQQQDAIVTSSQSVSRSLSGGYVGQSFTTRSFQITGVQLYLNCPSASSVEVRFRTTFDGPDISFVSSSVSTSSTSLVTFSFPSPINVVNGRRYMIVVRSIGSCFWMGEAYGTYQDGATWVSGAPTNWDLGMIVYGFLANNTCGPQTSSTSYTGTTCSWSQYSEFTFIQPYSTMQICTLDILDREALIPNVTVEFVVYESSINSISSVYNKISSITRTSGDGVAQASTTLTLRYDRFYAIGYACVSNCIGVLFSDSQCPQSWTEPNIGIYAGRNSSSQIVLLNSNFNLYSATIPTSVNLVTRFYTAIVPTTGRPLTTSRVTTRGATTGTVTTGRITTGSFNGESVDTQVFSYGAATGTVCLNCMASAQSFVTRSSYLTKFTIWVTASGSYIDLSLRTSYNGNILFQSSQVSVYGANTQVTFTPLSPIAVTRGQTYWIQLRTTSASTWSCFYNPGTYSQGMLWQGTAIPEYDCWFQVWGYASGQAPCATSVLPIYPAISTCPSYYQTEMIVLNPTQDTLLCSWDIVERELLTSSATIEFSLYESSSLDLNSIFTKVSNFTRIASDGNLILREIPTTYLLRADRYYGIGYTCVGSCTTLFTSYPCDGTWSEPKFNYIQSYTSLSPSMFPSSLLLNSLDASALKILSLQIGLGSISTTRGLTTYGTSGELTTLSPATSGEVTSEEFTSGDVTSNDLTTSELTTGEATTRSVTTNAIQGHLTSGLGAVVTSGDPIDQESSTSGNSNKSAVGAGIGVALSVLIIGGIIGVIILLRMRRNQPEPNPENSIQMETKPEDEEDKSKYQAIKSIAQEIQDQRHLSTVIPMLKDIEIKRKLGAGSYGEVFLGEWNGTEVALKRLKDKDQFDDFIKEAGTLSHVVHPNCVKFLGIYVQGTSQYLVIEYLPKGGLRGTLTTKRDKLTIIDLLTMCIGGAKGLSYLEEKQILHRDIALRNLLIAKIDGKYTTKVSDFGLARMPPGGVYNVKSPNKLPVKWTSIDVLKGGPITVKNDVWAYGVAMWEIFTFGEIPYGDISSKEAFTKILAGERLPRPPFCPEEVFDIIASCWHEKPEDRPSFAKLVKELKAVKHKILIEKPHLAKRTINLSEDSLQNKGTEYAAF